MGKQTTAFNFFVLSTPLAPGTLLATWTPHILTTAIYPLEATGRRCQLPREASFLPQFTFQPKFFSLVPSKGHTNSAMSEINPSVSNGSCWANVNVALEDEYIPCGNVADGNSYACCHYGDNCLASNACYHAQCKPFIYMLRARVFHSRLMQVLQSASHI